jgi:DNA-binding PadR family transcriptional regulator
MTTDSSGTTAKIYTFPPRGRFAMNAQREETQTVFQVPRGVKAASGAWYHDEAIQADEQSRKN